MNMAFGDQRRIVACGEADHQPVGFALEQLLDDGAAMLQGFNPEIELERSQTIMKGAARCDFQFRKKATSAC